MTPCKLTFTFDRLSATEVLTNACKARLHAQQREALCELLRCPVDSCYTTGELYRDAQHAGLLCVV